jgi:hypothetical protein
MNEGGKEAIHADEDVVPASSEFATWNVCLVAKPWKYRDFEGSARRPCKVEKIDLAVTIDHSINVLSGCSRLSREPRPGSK